MQLKASAPGSLMLLGEYAVLHGYPALVCAVNKRLSVQLTPRADEIISITSDRYGQYQTVITNLCSVDPFRFVLETMNHFAGALPSGCDIVIESAFSDQIGFGSSAALVVATLAVLNEWLQLGLSSHELLAHGREIVQVVQGRGSGADIAASVYGGMVAYCMQPLVAQPIGAICPLVTCYAGFKTKTADAIKKIDIAFKPYPLLFDSLMQAIGHCAKVGIERAHCSDWQGLGRIFSIQQGLMTALGVTLPILQQLVMQLERSQTILGAKISGAGLGDCVVGLGTVSDEFTSEISGTSYIPVTISTEGVSCERHG